MGTMNFSIPDDVKDAFNEAFDGENKSAVVADLLRRAVAMRASLGSERERRHRFDEALARLERTRAAGRTYSDEEIQRLRHDGRP